MRLLISSWRIRSFFVARDGCSLRLRTGHLSTHLLVMSRYAGFALFFFLSFSHGFAGDRWPQFRGPGQQGWADAEHLPLTWSETEHVTWKTEIPGEGWSSPVVEDGRIWLTTATEEGHSLRAICVDFKTGKILLDVEVFHREIVPFKHERNSYASPTPIVDGKRVYVYFGSDGVAALDSQTGATLWVNKELQVNFENGPGGSPVLYHGKLLFDCDGMDFQYQAALNAETGKLVWKTPRSAIPKLEARPMDMRKAYGTPVVIPVDGAPLSIAIGAERVYALDPDTGREVWYFDIPGFSNVPLPAWNDHFMVVATGFGKPELWGVRLRKAEGDITQTHIAWKQNAGAPAQSSPLLIGDRVYMVSDGGIASCLNAETGKIVWKQRIGSDFAASPLYAAHRIYFWDARAGCTVIEPGDTYKQLAKNELESGFMASPAVVGESLILRTKTHLYRIDDGVASTK